MGLNPPTSCTRGQSIKHSKVIVSAVLQGRPLKAGDLLPVGPAVPGVKPGNACPKAWLPAYPAEGAAWEIGVLPGPNAAPDYFTEEDIKTFYSAPYTVHYNS